MKIRFEEGYKRFYTVEQYEAAKIVIKYMQDYECTDNMRWLSERLAEVLLDYRGSVERIIEADVETCRRSGDDAVKWWDYFGEGSNEMDARIHGLAEIRIDGSKAFMEFSSTVSNAYQIGSEDFNPNENHTYKCAYTRRG